MRFILKIDRDEDGAWIAECPAISVCISQEKARVSIAIQHT